MDVNTYAKGRSLFIHVLVSDEIIKNLLNEAVDVERHFLSLSDICVDVLLLQIVPEYMIETQWKPTHFHPLKHNIDIKCTVIKQTLIIPFATEQWDGLNR